MYWRSRSSLVDVPVVVRSPKLNNVKHGVCFDDKLSWRHLVQCGPFVLSRSH